MAAKKPVLSVAIPFYNEEENARECIEDHLSALGKAGLDFEIIAVDNGSWDKTGEILDSLKGNRVCVVHIKKNMGFGQGVMAGWAAANGNYLAYNCGDNQIRAEALVRVFKKLDSEGLDLCKGKRVFRGYSWFRKLESFVYNSVFCRLLLGYRHGDVNGYPKAMKRSLYSSMRLRSKGSFFDTEMLVRAADLGAMVGSIPVEYKHREKGKSRIPFYIAFFFLGSLLKFKFRRLFGKL